MNDFLAFSQQYYWLLLLPLMGVALAHVIAFVLRRCFPLSLDESPHATEEPTQQSEQVIQLLNEIKRLRAELDIAKGQVSGQTLLSKSTPQHAIAKLAPTSPA
jgi:hypothetical protein